MSSGIKLADGIKDIYEESFKGSKKSKQDFMILKISDDEKTVEIDEFGMGEFDKIKIKRKDNPKGQYDGVTKIISDHYGAKCRYIFYKLGKKDGEITDNHRIVFIAWSSDSAKIKEKMLFASTKDQVKKCLEGLQTEIQAHDMQDLEYKDLVIKAFKK